MKSALFWDFTQRRLVVSCRRFGTRIGYEIFTAVLKIYITWDVSPCWLINLLSSSGPTAQDEGTMFHRNVRYPSPVDRAPSSSTPVWKLHVSQNRRPCQDKLLCVARLLRICDDHCRIHKTPYWTYFSFRVLWYIKALFTTNKCTILQSVFFLLHVAANKITRTL
jgi:hypothetical protein